MDDMDVKRNKQKIENRKREVINKIKDVNQECSEDEFLVIKNPNNKRIVHIMSGESPRNSLCKIFNIRGVTLFRVFSNQDLIGKEDKQKIKESHETCKKCLKSLE